MPTHKKRQWVSERQEGYVKDKRAIMLVDFIHNSPYHTNHSL